MSTSLDEALASRSAPGRLLRGVKPLDGLLRWLTEAYRIRQMENQLHELDDRMLRDIGLTRTEIAHLVRHGRGEPLGGQRD